MKLFSAPLRFAMIVLLVSSIAVAGPYAHCTAAGTIGESCNSVAEPADGEPTCCCHGNCEGKCCEYCTCGEGPGEQDKPVAPPTRSSGDEQQGVFASPSLKVPAFVFDGISNHANHGRLSLGGASAVPSLQMQHVRIQT